MGRKKLYVGERLRKARIQAGLSQGQLADKIHVSQASISNWEKESSIPRKDQKQKLSRVIGDLLDSVPSDISDTAPSSFGVWLNRTRIEEGKTVSEVAADSGVSIPAIYAIEAGRIANPRTETVKRLEKAFKSKLPKETSENVRSEATIEGMGELQDFNPHDDDDLPSEAGVYVLYDISDRPIYVGESNSIKSRIKSHRDRFWFKRPIVEHAAY